MKVELSSSSKKAIDLAAQYRLDRIELCQNLEIGGTTPTPGLVQYALEKGLDTHVLIRPRLGGFVYTEDELDIMARNIVFYRDMGAQGIVLGCYNNNKGLDMEQLSKFRDLAPGMKFTFHRAFDDLINWRDAIDQLFQIGFNRVLTSGLASSVDVGMNNFSFLKELMRGKIEFMLGGGISAQNVTEVINKGNPDAVHFSATSIIVESLPSRFNVPRLEVDEQKLKDILALIATAVL